MKDLLGEKILIFQLQTRKDPDAFAALYDRYVKPLYRFVSFKVPTGSVAEDITAETFLRMWNMVVENKRITHFRALAYQVARNLIADYYRSNESRQLSLEMVREHPVAKQEMQVEGIELSELVEALVGIKEEYADVIMLRYIEGLSTKEIAQVLEKGPGATRVQLHRAMAALRVVLKDKN